MATITPDPGPAWAAGYRSRAAEFDFPPIVEQFTRDDVVAHWNNGERCIYCDGPFDELDHMIPVARGGHHAIRNCAPSCTPCNRVALPSARRPRECESCGKVFPNRRAGRQRRYCTDACRQRGYRKRERASELEEIGLPTGHLASAKHAPAPPVKYAACEWDGTPIPYPSTRKGPGRKYCSSPCRQASYRARRAVVAEAEEILRGTVDSIPAELRERDRWVRWVVTRDGRKLPLRADRSRAASSTDPRTWSSYAEARDSSVGTGVGFVLGDGVGCIDLDDALDADGRVTSAVAEAVLAANPVAWVERSMSGRGLHVFGLLDEAPGRRTRGLEVYSRARFIALTGDEYRAGVGELVPLVVPTSRQ